MNRTNLMIFGAIFAIEVIIALFVHDSFFRPFVGDVLVVILIFYFVRIFYSKHIFSIIIGCLVFAYCIECLQFLKIVDILEIENRVLRTAIGTVFDWKDIGAYTVGGVCLFLITKWQGKQNLK